MSIEDKPTRRQMFVLTPEEKKMIVFVLCALLLGFATKCYRDSHSRPPPSSSANIEKAKTARAERPLPVSSAAK